MYIVSFANTGEDTVGPTSLTHKSEGLRGILEADTPVRIALPLNIFHESLSDTPNVCFPTNNVNFQYPKKNLYYYISYLLACLFCGDCQVLGPITTAMLNISANLSPYVTCY